MNLIFLDSCPSTNAVLAGLPDAPHGTAVWCRTQSAGRGQRGNSWEAEPGKNLTFSALIRPHVDWHPARQFEISMLVAITVADFIDRYLQRAGIDETVKIKWPNDIYYRNKKICGILIENSLSGQRIERSIAGIGINVNQEVFLSDAPNPVSMFQITGKELALAPMMDEIAMALEDNTRGYFDSPDFAALRRNYMNRLYRNDGKPHLFSEPDGTIVHASIVDVEPSGFLVLSNGKKYAFKEIIYTI